MAQRTECYVTNALPDGPAFAIRKDTDETVYIPKGVALSLELVDLDEIEAVVVANRKPVEPGGQAAAWFCVRARLLEDTEPDA